jgi:hypothetical protein
MRKPVAAVWDRDLRATIVICDDGAAFQLDTSMGASDDQNPNGYTWLQIPSIPGTDSSEVPADEP